jgi:hypothetical protein
MVSLICLLVLTFMSCAIYVVVFKCFIYQELGDVEEGPDILDMRSERILGLRLGSYWEV